MTTFETCYLPGGVLCPDCGFNLYFDMQAQDDLKNAVAIGQCTMPECSMKGKKLRVDLPRTTLKVEEGRES